MSSTKIGRALLLLALAGAAACTSAAADATSDESNFTADIAKSEELLAKAVSLAERHAAGGCEDDFVGRRDIVEVVQQAIAARDTIFFRTRVVAKKAVLARELAGTLDWQEILGVYVRARPETLGPALAAGVSIWDTNGGSFGNQQRIEFHGDGQASVFTLDTESADLHWNEQKTTWRLENGSARLVLGTGAVYDLSQSAGLTLKATVPGEDHMSFISEQSECDA